MRLVPKKVKKIDQDSEKAFVDLASFNDQIFEDYGRGYIPNASGFVNRQEFDINFILDELEDSSFLLKKEESEDLSFIIKKISQNIDYEERIRGFVYKIYESDHFDKVNDIKKIVYDFFEKRKELLPSMSKVEANLSAYNFATKNFLNEYEMFYKKAQYAENSPIYVAEQLAAIIKIMLQRIKPESRMKSTNSIREKIKEFNVPELSNKKSPGGAAIGVTLSLIKNTLMARDPFFIDSVIKELVLRL